MRKPWKYAISGVFSCQNPFDLFSQNLTKSDRKKVVNTEGTALFGASVVKFWGNFFEMRERKKYVWPHFSTLGTQCESRVLMATASVFRNNRSSVRIWPNLIIPILFYTHMRRPAESSSCRASLFSQKNKPPLHSPVAVRSQWPGFFSFLQTLQINLRNGG